MKKIALLFLLTWPVAQLFSQLSVSPIAGANITKVRFTEGPFKSDVALWYLIGMQAAYGISERVSGGLGLHYSVKGYNEDGKGPTLLSKSRLQYMEAVPFLEFRTMPSLGLLAGVGVGYLANESYKENGDWHEPAFELAEKWDISAMLGARYYFNHAFLALTLNHSIASVLDYRYIDNEGELAGKTYNQVLMFAVGYNFHLKKK